MAGCSALAIVMVPKRCKQLAPAFDDAWHVDGEDTAAWHLLETAFGEFLGRGGVRRPAAGVERVQLLRLGVADDGEQIAADAVHGRLDDGEHGRPR